MTTDQTSVDALRPLGAGVANIAERHLRGELNDAQFAAFYFLNWQIALHGKSFASRRRRGDARPNPMDWLASIDILRGSALSARLRGFFEGFQFRGVRPQVPIALAAWLDGRWALDLWADIPSPMDVLRAQARGRRMVTVITAFPRMAGPVLGKPNAFVFLQHDLEHAYKFFQVRAHYQDQCALFRALESAVDRGLLVSQTDDCSFAAKFHYLIGDMNTHPQHALQYLRAILIEHHLRRSGQPSSAELDPAARQEVERIMASIVAPGAVCAAG